MSFTRGFARGRPDGLRLAIKVTPKSSSDRLAGVEETPTGPRLRLAVISAPEKGKANKAACRLVAGELGLAKGRVSVISGTGSRLKQLLITGDPQELSRLLGRWLARHGIEC